MDGDTHPLLQDTKMIIGESEVVKALLHHSASNPDKMGCILLQNLAHGAHGENGIWGELGDHVWDFAGTSLRISASALFYFLVATDRYWQLPGIFVKPNLFKREISKYM